MAFEITNGPYLSVVASADLSASQYRFAVINSSGQLAIVASNGANADGVLVTKPSAQGQAGSLQYDGVAKVVVASAVTAGDAISSSANGRAQTATTGQRVLGRAMESASGAGQIVAVLLKVGGEPNA